ncbi:Kdta, waaa, partial [Globisporangium splendens]
MEFLVHRAYCGIWRAAEPLVTWYIKRKDLRRGVLPVVTAERFGVSKLPVQHGNDVVRDVLCYTAEWQQYTKGEYFTLWVHGASVGECLSVLPLIDMMLAESFALQMKTTPTDDGALSVPRRKARIVVSTTTPTARQLLNSRLGAIPLKTPCIFAPMDHPDWVKRFYDTWQPERIWKMVEEYVSSNLRVICLDPATTQRDSDAAAVTRIQKSIADRYAWAAVSTHEGEELEIARVHVELANHIAASDSRRVVTFIVPRHPHRAKSIADEIQRQVRTNSAPCVLLQLELYLGETGLLCDAISTVFVGGNVRSRLGTLAKRGGHNPIEPLRAGCKVFVGPNMQNFEDIVARIETTALKQQPHIDTNGEPVICSIQHPSELATALHRHFSSAADQETGMPMSPAKNQQHQSMMRALATQSLQAHERKLLEWLAK